MATDPASSNSEGIALRAQGRLDEAIAVFRAAAAAYPRIAALQVNLALTLDEHGDSEGALAAYEAARIVEPREPSTYAGAGQIYLRRGDVEAAARAYAGLLSVDPNHLLAHQALYELEQLRGNMAAALEHQRFVLARQQLFSSYAPHETRRVLALYAPGDLQTNVPLDFLIDPQTTTLHKLYVLDSEQLGGATLPPHDIVLNAIAESAHATGALALAGLFLRGQPRPALNDPVDVFKTQRTAIVKLLAGLDAIVPETAAYTRADLARMAPAFPSVIRPIDSHAGHGLEKVAGPEELAAYLTRTHGDTFFVSTFVDFKRPDGYYRKYRIIFVDGEPYPYHLAISPRWMIHYYNAENAANDWMRAEEAEFLEHFERVFGPELQAVLRELARRIGLEYFGIDCSIAPDGRLLLFEADAAMLVHLKDPADLYPYKHRTVPRIFRAFERLLDERIARSR
ncbi:MAG: tetratricopeptide repeat protein [Candidatus Velthaea sp.]